MVGYFLALAHLLDDPACPPPGLGVMVFRQTEVFPIGVPVGVIQRSEAHEEGRMKTLGRLTRHPVSDFRESNARGLIVSIFRRQ